MPITVSSVSGNRPDPYNGDGFVPIAHQMEASWEAESFVNTINAIPLPGFDKVINISVTKGIDDMPVTLNNITAGATNLNVQYIEPQYDPKTQNFVNTSVGVPIVTVSGNVGVIFIDKYFKYRELPKQVDETLDYPLGLPNIPNEGINLHLYKGSFMRYNSIYFYLTITHLKIKTGQTAVENLVAQKRIINDWEAGRLGLINKLNTIGV